MAKATPEGKVKKKLLDFLKSLGGDCFFYMPVQNGMGQTGIPDVMAIIKGVPFAFECKATPKQHPTVLQAYALDRIHRACGFAWVVDNESVELAEKMIWAIIESVDEGGEYLNADDLEEFARSDVTGVLYRWKDKLEVMEFEDGTCSQG
uniref:Hydrolase n=1 Tax=Podoviridae sp. ct53O25 TaxID=2826539 RepID=A0A8S5MBU5_9CAUD|nr:MAG TPA: hydrolase [Podoviridae sp. ct53O25]